MEPPWEGGTKVYINGPGHMTKLAAMPIYGKNLKNILLQNQKSYDLETWHVASGTQALLPAFQHRNAAEGRISVRLESQAYTLDV